MKLLKSGCIWLSVLAMTAVFSVCAFAQTTTTGYTPAPPTVDYTGLEQALETELGSVITGPGVAVVTIAIGLMAFFLVWRLIKKGMAAR